MDFMLEWIYRLEELGNSDGVVAEAWTDFGPVAKVRTNIGPSPTGDPIPR